MEQLIGDVCHADRSFRVANLRNFNPVGAHVSGWLGEDPAGIPSNLMLYICQVTVTSATWRAHADALQYLARAERSLTVNLGTGRGVSVLELVQAFQRAGGRRIPYELVARRAGDVATVYADASLAQALLGWRATLDMDDMCRDAWRWQSMNPHGYTDALPRRSRRTGAACADGPATTVLKTGRSRAPGREAMREPVRAREVVPVD